MLLHHARRRSRTRTGRGDRAAGRAGPQPLGHRARSPRGSTILQAALARDRLGEYQAQAAIAALHADAPRVEDTDWVQIVEWYDELLRFADTPIVRLNRAVAVGEADGAPAGLAALAEVDEDVPRRDAVAAHLHERNGDLELAARLYAAAARQRAEPRRARPPDPSGGTAQPAPAVSGDRSGRRLSPRSRRGRAAREELLTQDVGVAGVLRQLAEDLQLQRPDRA